MSSSTLFQTKLHKNDGRENHAKIDKFSRGA